MLANIKIQIWNEVRKRQQAALQASESEEVLKREEALQAREEAVRRREEALQERESCMENLIKDHDCQPLPRYALDFVDLFQLSQSS